VTIGRSAFVEIKLKPIQEQVIVITGASSGIGLATARLAAKKGAKVVVAARSGDALRELANEIDVQGGRAAPVTADVRNQEDVREIARVAISEFGGFDTWINDAGVSIYGRLTEIPVEEMRELFETNFWGEVYGSLEAVDHLRDKGGALINIGSTVSDRAIPLQGIYSASKHAIKGFTTALRMELEKDDVPISVTLVKPGSINTPFTHHAENEMDAEPSIPPPVYDPSVAAEAILHCAETPVRDIFVGGGGKALSVFGYHAPRLTDKAMEAFVFAASKRRIPPLPGDRNGLVEPTGTLQERGDYPGMVRDFSLYTEAEMHPKGTSLALAGTAGALAWWLRSRRNGHQA
jgi:short-subunit dehydrogenase